MKNFKIGDVVVLMESNLPRGKWPLGRMIDIFPGKDGIVRVVKVKKKDGLYVRPVAKLSILPSCS